MSDSNPYSPPQTTAIARAVVVDYGLTEKDLKKANAIIKDANQFWLAILLCLLCSMIGAILIPIWYGVRLLQWNALGKKYPILVDWETNDELPRRFRSAKWKLIVGIVVGILIFAGISSWYFLATVFNP